MLETLYYMLRKVFKYTKSKVFIAGAGLLVVILISGFSFSYFEGRPLRESFYWTFITITTIGYGDIYPQTEAGRMVAIATALTGIAFFTVFVGLIADYVMIRATRRARGELPVKARGHVVILGWDEAAETLLSELRAKAPDRRIVLLNREGPLITEGEISTVRGDPTKAEDLRRASLESASHVIVTTGDDSRTILAVLHARRLNPNATIIAEALRDENMELIKQAGADTVVLTSSLGGMLLASAVTEPAIPKFIEDLAGATTGVVDVVERPASRYAGLRFSEALLKAKMEEDALILAIIKDGKLVANPPGDYLIDEEDRLLILVRSRRTP